MPSFSAAPGRMPSRNTSASADQPQQHRAALRRRAGRCRCRGVPRVRGSSSSGSPVSDPARPGRSTLVTWAPRSPSSIAANGTGPRLLRHTTRTSSSACGPAVPWSLVLPYRVAALAEGGDALGRVLRGEHRFQVGPLPLEALGERPVGRVDRDRLGGTTDIGAFAATCAASSSAAVSACPSSTRRLTRPNCAARAASSGAPGDDELHGERRAAAAAAAGTRRRRGRRVRGAPRAGRTGRSCPPVTRSQASTISKPPPSAHPSTAAISGLAGGRSTMPPKPRAGSLTCSPAANALRSMPGAEGGAVAVQHADPQLGRAVEQVERAGDAGRHRAVHGVALRPAG